MEDYQLKFEKSIGSKEYVDDKTFKIIAENIGENTASSHKLLDLVLKYLEIYPQQVTLIPERDFLKIVSTKQPLHPLALFIATRRDDIGYEINLNKLPEEKWAYLLSAFYRKRPSIIFNPVFVHNVKNNMDTYKMLIDCPQWFNDNVDFFTGLHSIEFDANECDKLFTQLENDWSVFKITKAAVSFVDLVATKCNKEVEFIQFLVETLFSLPPENDNITWLSKQIINNLKLLETNCSIHMDDIEAIPTKAIKYGLQENPEYGFIRVLRRLVKKVNLDKSLPKKTFELLSGHSKFMGIMLNQKSNHFQKGEVLRLFKTLVKVEPSLMALTHVPFFLCSYNASLSIPDQLILKILEYYEANSIPISNYRPYLWGSFAVSYYQVTNHLTTKTLNNVPSTAEVLSYVPLKRLKETLSCFPMDRILLVKDSKIIHYDENGSKDPSNMFDPAFFLPMISSLLATEAPLSIEKFTRNGCLSMVLACLGSTDRCMRSAAYLVLSQLKSHLFCRRAENLFWDYVLSWIKMGLQNLNLSPPPRIPMIQALFLSRMVMSIATHEKSIEKMCSQLLLSYPAARLGHITELKTFLTPNSIVKDKPLHTRWFFEILRDGTRSKIDWEVLKNMDILNILLMMIKNCSTSHRLLILKVMETVFSIQPATNGGSGPWAISLMIAISKYLDKFNSEEILATFQCIQSMSGSSFIREPVIEFWLSIFLDYGNEPDIYSAGIVTLNDLVSKYTKSWETLNDDAIKDIICFGENSNVLSEDEVFKCRSALEYGVDGFVIEEANSFTLLPILIKILKNKNKFFL